MKEFRQPPVDNFRHVSDGPAARDVRHHEEFGAETPTSMKTNSPKGCVTTVRFAAVAVPPRLNQRNVRVRARGAPDDVLTRIFRADVARLATAFKVTR